MNWIIYSLIAIAIVGISDIFRKLGSNLKDPIFSNFVFQAGSFFAATVLFLTSRKVVNDKQSIIYAVIGGILISIFTLFSFKALLTGPGVSVVMPVLRVGGIALVVLLSVVILKEKLSGQTIFGLVLSAMGIYLLFSNK